MTLTRMQSLALASLVGIAVWFADAHVLPGLGIAFLSLLAAMMIWVTLKTRWIEDRYTPQINMVQNASIGGVIGWSGTNFLMGFV